MRSGRLLRRAIMNRIIAEVPALSGRVYDSATETTPFPYVTLGPSYWTDASVACVKAKEVTVQIDVWHSGSNKGVLEDLTDDVSAALDGYAETDDLTGHPMRVALVRVMDDLEAGVVHGVIQVEAMVEATSA